MILFRVMIFPQWFRKFCHSRFVISNWVRCFWGGGFKTICSRWKNFHFSLSIVLQVHIGRFIRFLVWERIYSSNRNLRALMLCILCEDYQNMSKYLFNFCVISNILLYVKLERNFAVNFCGILFKGKYFCVLSNILVYAKFIFVCSSISCVVYTFILELGTWNAVSVRSWPW